MFTGRKRRQQALPPAPLPGTARVSSVKILGVTISSSLSVSQHVTNVVNSCAQTIYALRTLRAHGRKDSTLHMVYLSAIVAKLLYAASAWYGFSTADDRQRLEAVIWRGIRSKLCPTNQLTVRELVDDADESLFTNILYSRNHILHQFLPQRRNWPYDLRDRTHDRELIQKETGLEKEFITRMLFKDSYWQNNCVSDWVNERMNLD